jgi:hypothetical protein
MKYAVLIAYDGAAWDLTVTGAPAVTATGEPRHTLPSAHAVMKIVLLDSEELVAGVAESIGVSDTVGVPVGVTAPEPLGAGTSDAAAGPPDGAATYDGASGAYDESPDGAVGAVGDADSATGPPDGAAATDGVAPAATAAAAMSAAESTTLKTRTSESATVAKLPPACAASPLYPR